MAKSTSYVELLVAYIPASNRDKAHLIANVGISVGRGDAFLYPDFKTDLWKIKKHQTCKETYYDILSEEQLTLILSGR